MRLKLIFCSSGTKEVYWNKTLAEFPKLVAYYGKKWEWAIYESDDTGHCDWVCTFVEVASYDPNWWATYTDVNNLYGQDEDGCECGAKFSSFSWDHMRFCKKWTPWK